MMKIVNFNTNVIWSVVVLFIAVITGIAIADEKWIYFSIVLIPFLVYCCIEKPFIFPFGAYVFLLPFNNLLSVMGSAQGATMTKFLGILTILVLCLKGIFENKMKKPDTASIWMVLFVMYGVLSINWAIVPEFVLTKIPTAMGLLLLYLVVASYQLQKKELETLKLCIFFGGLIAALFTIYAYNTGHSIQRTSLSYGDRTENPNALAFSLLLPLSICIEMILRQNKKLIVKSLYAIIIIVFAYGIIVSGSRGGFLAMGTVVIVYILFAKQRITLGTILVVIGIVVFSIIPEFFVERLRESSESGGAGRIAIWQIGGLALKKYWVLGAGLNNFPNAYNEFAYYGHSFKGLSKGPHNIYLGISVELGIVGISFFVWGIIKHYQAINMLFTQYTSSQVMLKAALFGMLISCFFSTFIWSKSLWLIWMLIIMYRNISEDKYKEQPSYYQRDVVDDEQLAVGDRHIYNKID